MTATIEQVTFEGNAFGLFVTDTSALTIDHAAISGSLIDGLVLHRFVTDAVISDTSSTGNAVDGITVDRSSQRLTFTSVTATGNGRNGLTIDGSPLADGPSASGSSVVSYGNSRISGGVFSDNGRYGVEIAGGHDVLVTDSVLEANEIGVVTSGLAAGVTIRGNDFGDQVRQSVAVRDGSVNVSVLDNSVRGGDTGIYVRNAQVVIEGNTLTGLTNHGVTLVGSSANTEVRDNSIGGSGTTAIYRDELAASALVSGNRTAEWRPSVTVASVARGFFQPLSIVWLALGLLLVLTALARGRRHRHSIVDPYASRAPLATFTRGIVSPLGERRGG